MVCRGWSSKPPSDNGDGPSEVKAAMSAAVFGPLVSENCGLKSRVAQLSQKVLANAEELADERLRYVKEIAKLNLDNDELSQKVLANAEELADERLRYVKEIDKLNLDNATRLRTSNELKKSNDELKAEIVHLKTIIADQQSKIDELVKSNKEKDDDITWLMNTTRELMSTNVRLLRRENLITAREAMRALEWFICVETVGAKTRVANEKLFTIAAIEKRSELKRKLPTWVTPEVVVELRKTKSGGSAAIHDAPFTHDEVEEAFADADPDSKALKMMMLKMLDAYYTLHSLPFGKPFEKQ
jgi:hypothetical protein